MTENNDHPIVWALVIGLAIGAAIALAHEYLMSRGMLQ